MASEVVGTVTDDSPLTVLVDGADTVCPAESLSEVAYSVNDRVQMTVRTPMMPLVTGKVATAT